jgi:hypothetical protein
LTVWLSSKGMTWSSSKTSSFLLWSRKGYPAVRRKYFISAVRNLFLSLCLIVQISLPYKRMGRANFLYNFNLVLLCTKFGFSVLFKSPSICKTFVILECIVTNLRVLFHDGTLLHSKFNTQLLITVSNFSRIPAHGTYRNTTANYNPSNGSTAFCF